MVFSLLLDLRGAVNTTTAFYDALAPMFDVMTDWDARLAAEGPFLRAQLDAVGAHRVLDAACGSGGHVLWLAQQGYAVAGADVSPVMIDLARQKVSARPDWRWSFSSPILPSFNLPTLNV